MSLSREPVAVYVHIPFCPSKCGYCDFNSYAMDGEIVERTTRATVQEISRSPTAGRRAKTIFFGGGTPTFLSERQLISILEAVVSVHPPTEGCEITSEANPGTVDTAKFRAMVGSGFNRLSLGAQSFLDSDLIALGRIHRSDAIGRAVVAARDAGFVNLNLDLMFALPGQSLRGWRANLDRALALAPEHLSLYCLTLEPNTDFYKRHLHGLLGLPDDDCQVSMYEECLDRLSTYGYEQYEISNFAQPGRECRHNLCYWHGEEYAGYGPGAVGCIDRVRSTNLKHPRAYSEAVEAGLATSYESETLTPELIRMERIMLGLRLNEGLPFTPDLPEGPLARVEQRGWVRRESDRIRLTDAGRHFCSEVALELV